MQECKLSSLIIDVRPGERLALADVATVELVHKSGQAARLRVTAPRTVLIEKQPGAEAEKDVPRMTE